jgi:hypothetical protein
VTKAPALAASSFAVVADLRPARPVIVLMTPVYFEHGDSGCCYDHRIAVLFDEDEDERVIDVLTAILYRAAHAFAKIAAVHEHKGLMTVWVRDVTAQEKAAISAATDVTVLRGDCWPVEYHQALSVAGAEGLDALDIEVARLNELFGLGKPSATPDPSAAAKVPLRADSPSAFTSDTTLTLKRGRGRRE